ncbi:imidazolonepropionase [bacterium]|nr:imidazolonepropionase [bacterium]
MQTLFENTRLFRANPDHPTVEEDMAVLVEDGIIAWVGQQEAIPQDRLNKPERRDLGGHLLTPGLIDCHTHIVWGGTREEEFVRRAAGASYEEILRQGGGILSTVRETRRADAGELFENALPRLEQFRQQGVTTIEAKSGYGLTFEDEMKILEVIRDLDEKSSIELVPTLLGAHAVPPEFKSNRGAYVDLVCEKMIPEAEGRGLAMAVDVFCERGAFTLEETRRIFEAAHHSGFHFKVHAEQLTHTGAAQLAGEMGALSADHLEHLDDAGVEAMRQGRSVAVLLPGAMLTLGTQRPPVEKLRAAGVPIAISTDCNPGSSHTTNLHLMMSLGAIMLGMTAEEIMLSVTHNAAKALGLDERLGRIEEGLEADLCVWNCRSLAAIPYGLGENLVMHSYKKGRMLT